MKWSDEKRALMHNLFVAIVSLWVMLSSGVVRAASTEFSQAIPITGDSVMKNFRVPMYDDQSVMTSQLFGDTARVLPDGNVEITGLKMEFYTYVDEQRITEMTVTSPLCLYNRGRGAVMSDSDVRISRNEMVVTGRGFRYDNDKQELMIYKDSRVVLKSASRKKQDESGKRE